jgi:hypothetical protein
MYDDNTTIKAKQNTLQLVSVTDTYIDDEQVSINIGSVSKHDHLVGRPINILRPCSQTPSEAIILQIFDHIENAPMRQSFPHS